MMVRLLSVILPCLSLLYVSGIFNSWNVQASPATTVVAVGPGKPNMSQGGKVMTISLSSTAFGNMETIPKVYTCDGADISPPLSWSGLPQGTRSVVLICDDPDAPRGTWVHWVCYDIPPSSTGLPEKVPNNDQISSGGLQGISDFNNIGYGGPCPPSGTHRYFFKLYALDRMLGFQAGKSKKEIEQAMKGHILDEAQLIGTYSRRR